MNAELIVLLFLASSTILCGGSYWLLLKLIEYLARKDNADVTTPSRKNNSH